MPATIKRFTQPENNCVLAWLSPGKPNSILLRHIEIVRSEIPEYEVKDMSGKAVVLLQAKFRVSNDKDPGRWWSGRIATGFSADGVPLQTYRQSTHVC